MLHSIILGEGTPMLILHGFLGMADNWKTLGRQWSESGFEVHLLDQRNHGRSMHSPNFDYDQMASDIKEYCTHHQLENIILIGHSMGGKVAMKVAAAYPELIAKMVIADIAPKTYPPHHSDIIHALQAVDLDQIKSRKEAAQSLSVRITDAGTRQFLLKSLHRAKDNKYAWRFNLKVLSTAQEKVGQHQPMDHMVNTPTLFIRGGESGYITDQDQLLIDNAFAKASLKTIEGAGHWLHAQKPQEFFTYVTNFVR